MEPHTQGNTLNATDLAHELGVYLLNTYLPQTSVPGIQTKLRLVKRLIELRDEKEKDARKLLDGPHLGDSNMLKYAREVSSLNEEIQSIYKQIHRLLDDDIYEMNCSLSYVQNALEIENKCVETKNTPIPNDSEDEEADGDWNQDKRAKYTDTPLRRDDGHKDPVRIEMELSISKLADPPLGWKDGLAINDTNNIAHISGPRNREKVSAILTGSGLSCDIPRHDVVSDSIGITTNQEKAACFCFCSMSNERHKRESEGMSNSKGKKEQINKDHISGSLDPALCQFRDPSKGSVKMSPSLNMIFSGSTPNTILVCSNIFSCPKRYYHLNCTQMYICLTSIGRMPRSSTVSTWICPLCIRNGYTPSLINYIKQL